MGELGLKKQLLVDKAGNVGGMQKKVVYKGG